MSAVTGLDALEAVNRQRVEANERGDVEALRAAADDLRTVAAQHDLVIPDAARTYIKSAKGQMKGQTEYTWEVAGASEELAEAYILIMQANK